MLSQQGQLLWRRGRLKPHTPAVAPEVLYRALGASASQVLFIDTGARPMGSTMSSSVTNAETRYSRMRTA